jgi:transposase InsO family protein
MSRRGNPYDNAQMERFMSTLKYEDRLPAHAYRGNAASFPSTKRSTYTRENALILIGLASLIAAFLLFPRKIHLWLAALPGYAGGR